MAETTTISWICDTSEALGHAIDATKSQSQISGLSDVRDSLAETLDEFRQIAHADVVARSFGWAGKEPNPDLFEDLRRAQASLDSRPLGQLARSIERYRADVRAVLIEQWRQYASERMGDVGGLLVLAKTLSQVEGLAGLSESFEQVLGKLARAQGQLPSERSIELLRDAENKHELEKSLQPEAVRRFLSAVARGGASVDLLTADVATWLRTHHATASFRVVAGVPIGDADE